MSAELAPVAREDHPRTVDAMLKLHRSMLNRLAFKYWSTNRRQAELQDFRSVANVAAWKAWERYDPSRGLKLRWWIYGKARGALQDYTRVLYGGRSKRSEAHVRKAAVVQLDELEAVLPGPVHEDPAVALELARRNAQLREDLRAAIEKMLTPDQAAAVISMYYGGLSQVEAARKLGCTGGNISTLHRRALERLRRRFVA